VMNNISKDNIDIFNELQNSQNSDAILEKILMQLVLNPARIKIQKKNLTDFNGNTVAIAQSIEGTAINPAGFPTEEVCEDVFVLDDGTSLCGISVCQTCGGIVKEENIRRCECGKTICLRRGCAKYSAYKNTWYCCSWHKFLGNLGINLR
ncbi:MAG: hypothetical protein ACYC25_08980, partial [Paludibacter sp.]